MIFEKLPQLEHCCCCIPLKFGTLFIGIIFLLEGCRVAIFKFVLSPQDKVCHDGIKHEECPLREAWTCISYTTLCLKLVVFFSAVFLIVGVLVNNRVLVTAFMYCLTAGELSYILVSTFLFLAAMAVPACGVKEEHDVAFCTIFGFSMLIICCYVLVVAKSYRTTMHGPRQRQVRISDISTSEPSPPQKKASLADNPEPLTRKPSMKRVGTPPRKLELEFEDK